MRDNNSSDNIILTDALKYWWFVCSEKLQQDEYAVVLEIDNLTVLNIEIDYLEELKIRKNALGLKLVVSDLRKFCESVDNADSIGYEIIECDSKYIDIIQRLPEITPVRSKIIVATLGSIYGIELNEFILSDTTIRDFVLMALFGIKPLNEQTEQYIGIGIKDILPHRQFLPPDIHVCDVSRRNYVMDNLAALLESGAITTTDDIYIWGVSNPTLWVIDRLYPNYRIVGIVDHRAKGNATFHGYKIITPQEIEDKANTRIIVSIYSYMEVILEAHGLGFKLGERFFPVNRELSYNCRNSSYEDEEKKLVTILETGQAVSEKLVSRYGIDYDIFLCPYKGMGDIYLIVHYLVELKTRFAKNPIIVVYNNFLCSISHGLGIEAISIPFDDITSAIYYCCLTNRRDLHIADINICNVVGRQLLGISGLDYNSMLHKLLFPNAAVNGFRRIQPKEVDDIDSKYGISNWNKTVILSPYANSMKRLPVELWESIANKLKDLGFDVRTNVAKDEVPIKGTDGIFIPIDELLDFLDKIKVFIGLRSGLCDVISQAGCELIILYSGCINRCITTLDFYSLKKMGLREDKLTEIYIENDDYDEAVNNIVMQIQNMM